MRKIEKELLQYIDARLSLNGRAQEAISKKDSRALVALAATTLVGIKEATGKNDGKYIRLIQETVGDAQGESYCISGIMTCVAYAEVKTGIKSHLKATEGAQDLFKSTPKKYRVKSIPLPGAIMLWADVGKWTGHGEIVLAADDKIIQCVGFNTSGSVKPNDPVNREGNGVYYTTRSYKSTAKRKLLGFIKPF